MSLQPKYAVRDFAIAVDIEALEPRPDCIGMVEVIVILASISLLCCKACRVSNIIFARGLLIGKLLWESDKFISGALTVNPRLISES